MIGALDSIPKNLPRHLESLWIKVSWRCINQHCLVQLISCERFFLSEVIDLTERTIYDKSSNTDVYCENNNNNNNNNDDDDDDNNNDEDDDGNDNVTIFQQDL